MIVTIIPAYIIVREIKSMVSAVKEREEEYKTEAVEAVVSSKKY